MSIILVKSRDDPSIVSNDVLMILRVLLIILIMGNMRIVML